MAKKKMLHIQLLPLLSGVQNVMLQILDGLDPEEFEIYVACRPGGPLVDAVKARGYRYLPLPFLVRDISILDIAVFFQLLWLCRKYRFDIVHTHSSKPGLLGRIAARLMRVPLVIHTGHGAPFHDGQPDRLKRLYMRMERLGALFCHKMIFVNNYHRKLYLKHKLIRPDKAVTIYNAVSPEFLRSLEALPQPLKNRQEPVVIGSVLRFSRQKNIVMTIIGCIRVCHARRDVRFIFVGDGEQFDLCKRMVATNRLQERILLPGWQNDTEQWLRQFDAFLLYSDYEGLPVSIIEAMYAGLPVIGSNLPAIAELVTPKTGWLIPAGKLEQLEAELHKIIDARDSYAEKGRAGRNAIESLCNYQSFLAAHLSLYREGRK
jgi:glycosyltransferase involved in cell wall biosynthesis